VVGKTNRYKTRQVDSGFWKLLKTKAVEEECTIMELQRRMAKANDIKLREPVYKRTPNTEGRFKF
jgi:hypothetical protein